MSYSTARLLSGAESTQRIQQSVIDTKLANHKAIEDLDLLTRFSLRQ